MKLALGPSVPSAADPLLADLACGFNDLYLCGFYICLLSHSGQTLLYLLEVKEWPKPCLSAKKKKKKATFNPST